MYLAQPDSVPYSDATPHHHLFAQLTRQITQLSCLISQRNCSYFPFNATAAVPQATQPPSFLTQLRRTFSGCSIYATVTFFILVVLQPFRALP
jgi:hypothetical protein